MSFVHASAPRAIENGRVGMKVIEARVGAGGPNTTTPAAKKKYRDPLLDDLHSDTTYIKPNIMFDPRVLRGTTAGKTAILASTLKAQELGQTIPTNTTQIQSSYTNTLPKSSSSSSTYTRPTKQQLLNAGLIRPSQPSVAYIHNHITVVKKRVEVPMHLYLIEQKEETLVHDIDQQTDAMMAEAPTPDYIPRKTGIDTSTQVDNAMVFNFDQDVQAILEVVVSKNLEQALMEVREEEELAAIESHKQELLAKYDDEEAQAKEKLRQERALFAAKEKLLADARLKQAHIVSIRGKLAAGLFSRRYLADLQRYAIDDLRKEGLFNHIDSVAHQIEQTYLPGLSTAVDLSLVQMSGARSLVTELMNDALVQEKDRTSAILATRAKEQAELEAARALEREREAELARRRAPVQLFIHTTAVPSDQSPVGPINLTGESTIDDIETKVYRWMENNLSDDELPPRERLRFLWDGRELSKEVPTTVYELGISNLATLTMELIEPPKPEKAEGEGSEGDEEDDEDEDDENEQEEEEEEEEEEDGDV